MAKYKIDYHEQTGRYFIRYKPKDGPETVSSHKLISVLLVGVRKKYGPGGYTLTRKARKAHG